MPRTLLTLTLALLTGSAATLLAQTKPAPKPPATTSAPATRTTRVAAARITAAHADLALLRDALDSYDLDNGDYPTTVLTLDALVNRPPNLQTWNQLLDHLPKDPWGAPFVYLCPGIHNPKGYDLSSNGPDTLPNTPDDITNWRDEK